MTYRHRFTADGVNQERLIWSQIDSAIELPSVVQRTTQTLLIRFGRTFAGWEFAGKRRERPGPALDLSAAKRVVLTARRFPQRPMHIERETFAHPGRGIYHRLFTLFELEGELDPDRLCGIARWTIPAANLDTAGRYVLSPRITFVDGREAVPKLFKLELIPSVEAW